MLVLYVNSHRERNGVERSDDWLALLFVETVPHSPAFSNGRAPHFTMHGACGMVLENFPAKTHPFSFARWTIQGGNHF